MHRAVAVWVSLTLVAAVLLRCVAWLTSETQAAGWIAAGVGVSLATFVLGKATVAASPVRRDPLPRLWLETSIRMVLPLAALAAVAVMRRELLETRFLLYFLPFQFITLIADTVGAVRRVNAED